MKSFGASSIAAAALSGALFAATPVFADVEAIVIKGSHFFYENGTEFFIRGMAYQTDINSNSTAGTTFVDPLADEASCTRDVPILQEMDTNVVRVYAVNASLDHTACMTLLADAGIYLIVDLENPDTAIDRSDPEWTTTLFADYVAVIDAFSNFTNTLGFFAGNEVSNEVSNTDASAFVKASVRDTKAYIKANVARSIGVGYATNDNAAIRTELADYFNCGSVEDSIDFWGYNIYSWCGYSSYTVSGYNERTAEFANYSVPAFFSEYGCNTVEPRPFTEIEAIYGDNMTGVWSGGIVYEYFQETNDYGVISVIDSTSVSKLAGYTSVSSRLADTTPSSTSSSDYTVTNTALQACPTIGSNWAASSNLPPVADSTLCSCMMDSLDCEAVTGLSSNTTADLFSEVCGLSAAACDGIDANGTTGVYGAYSMCSSYQQLSWTFNRYYVLQDKVSTACDFSGSAKVKTGTTSDSCSALLDDAGTEGTGTVSGSATAVATETGTGTTSSSSATSSTSKKSAAGSVVIPKFDMGQLRLGAYLVFAGALGAGMILL